MVSELVHSAIFGHVGRFLWVVLDVIYELL